MRIGYRDDWRKASCQRQGLVRRSFQGQMMLLVTVALIVLLGLAGLATDFGLLWTEKRQIQTAADAAAVAGALAVVSGGNATTAAKTDSSVNGFTDGSNSVTVTVNNPPTSGAYAGDSSAVEAIVSKPESTYFLRVLGYNSVPIEGRAVAHTGAHDCIYVMDPSANNALVASGGSSLSSSCGILVNSNSTSGLVASGGACVSATAIGVNASSESQAGCVSPAANFNVPRAPDPLAYLTEPTPGTCTASTTSGNGYTATNGATISQGTYCGGIKVQGGATLNLNPGLYILNGGGLTVSGTSNIIGDGVTFYNTGTSSGSTAYKPIVVSGGSTTSLTAPTSGSYAGILFFEARGLSTSSNGQKNAISGASGAQFTGALYFLNSELDFTGGSSAAYTVIVADILNITGGTTVGNNYSTLGGASPARETASLGE
jgi:hypothetical protein